MSIMFPLTFFNVSIKDGVLLLLSAHELLQVPVGPCELLCVSKPSMGEDQGPSADTDLPASACQPGTAKRHHCNTKGLPLHRTALSLSS